MAPKFTSMAVSTCEEYFLRTALPHRAPPLVHKFTFQTAKFQTAKFQLAMHHRPYCLSRPRAGPSSFSFFVPSPKRGGWRAKGRNHLFFCARGPSRDRGAPLGAPPRQACAVRAYLRASSFRRRAALFVAAPTWAASVSQAPGGRPVLATRRSPGAARVRACEARPRAPHPVPPSDASRRRPSMSRTIGLYSR